MRADLWPRGGRGAQAMSWRGRTAVDGTFAPHAMPRLEGGIEGFNVDLADEIVRRLKRPVEIAAMQFAGILPALQAGTLDFLAAPVAVTDLKQLKGRIIAVNKGSAYDSWARDLEKEISSSCSGWCSPWCWQPLPRRSSGQG
jgi:ABC-type amino acid transport substrate-binding protein